MKYNDHHPELMSLLIVYANSSLSLLTSIVVSTHLLIVSTHIDRRLCHLPVVCACVCVQLSAISLSLCIPSSA